MALIPAKMTQKGLKTAMDGVAQFLTPHRNAEARADALGGTAAFPQLSSHDLAAPHEIFTLNLSDVAKGLEAAKPTGWRYLVMEGDQVVAAANLDRPKKGDPSGPTFSGLNAGGFVASSFLALQAAESLPDVKKQDYQLRLLQIPAVYVAALWLHGKSKDLLLPLQSAEPAAAALGGNPQNPCLSPEEFFNSIAAQVKLTSEFDNSPEASRKQAKSTAGAKKAPRKSGPSPK